MRLVCCLAVVLAPLSPLVARAPAQQPIRVVRHSPVDTARSGDVITISFDRPVVGSLDRTPDPTRIVTVRPSLDAEMQWRDPTTIRIIPRTPLAPSRRYRFTLSNEFTAIDGGHLEAPYEFTLLTRGPRVLASMPSLRPVYPVSLDPSGALKLVYSAPVDSLLVARTARIEINPENGCVRRSVPYAIRAQRPIAETDDWSLRQAGGWDRDTTGDRFRRIVELRPTSVLPEDCSGAVVLPSLDPADRAEIRYPIASARRFVFERLDCANSDCAAGQHLRVWFTAPVHRDSLTRRIHLEPSVPFTVVESSDANTVWSVRLAIRPRTTYRVWVDSSLTDIFGRRLTGTGSRSVTAGDRVPTLGHQLGFFSVSRVRPVLRITHVNVDSAELAIVPIPNALRTVILDGHTDADSAARMVSRLQDTVFRRVRLSSPFNVERISEVPLPIASLGAPQATLFAIRARPLARRDTSKVQSGIETGVIVRGPPLARIVTRPAIVQLTDLIVNAKVADGWGAVLVTSAMTGRPVAGASVTTRDASSAVVATGVTDSTGVAELHASRAWRLSADTAASMEWYYNAAGTAVRLIEVSHGADQSITPTTTSRWTSPVDAIDRLGGWVTATRSVRAIVFADRGIYRPGETVYLTTALRRGHLGSLRIPAHGDSVRFRITRHSLGERDPVTVRDTTLRVNDFGTASDSIVLGRAWALGSYSVYADAWVSDRWQNAGAGSFQLAEYRAPEFETSLVLDTTARYLGDTLRARATGRYYFGAPMAGALVHWRAFTSDAGGFTLPGLPDGFSMGETYVGGPTTPGRAETITGIDTLDATGSVTLRIPTRLGESTWPADVDVSVSVDDLNRQAVSSDESTMLHASNLYLAARDSGTSWYWKPNGRRRFQVLAVRPDGKRVSGVAVSVSVLRHHHVYATSSNGESPNARWVTDTVLRTSLVSADTAVRFDFTPRTTGSYGIVFSARNERGRTISTSLGAYVLGGDWTPWQETPLRLPLELDRDSVGPGDTLTVRFVSPFPRAEAWVTVEREEIIAQRRVRVGAGESVVRIPVTGQFIPGGHVSVLVADSGNAWMSDSIHQRIRIGYARFSVDRSSKSLIVEVRPLARTFAPGDSMTVTVSLSDRQSRPLAGQVTLWAIDEGVAALTGYDVEDPLGRIYAGYATGLAFVTSAKHLRSRGRLLSPPGWNVGLYDQMEGSHLALAAMAVGSPAANGVILTRRAVDPRRDFRSTAFYVASLIVGADGQATARVKLPDNLTTYRVFAIAMTKDDRYGAGDSSFVVTKPLFARASLPRFLRTGDVMLAGAVINNTTTDSIVTLVGATGRGITRAGLRDPVTRSVAANRGSEVRFDWRADGAPGENAVVRFDVRGGGHDDAVETSVPMRTPYSPRYHAVAGVAQGASTVRMTLPRGIDPVRSRLTLRVGMSPIPIIRAAYERVAVYPFYCSEQLTSTGQVILTMLRLQGAGVLDSTAAPTAATLRGRLQFVVDELSRRQASSGGIGYWTRDAWTDPWLTSYAGTLLIDARAAGFDVDPAVIQRVIRFVSFDPDTTSWVKEEAYGTRVERERAAAWRLSRELAVLHFLRKAGAADTTLENRLLSASGRMTWEDRVWLAELLAGRADRLLARAQLQRVWRDVEMAGIRVDIPDSLLQTLGFRSHVRPVARLLRATKTIDPNHPRLPALIERVVQQGRAERDWAWNTQDYWEVTNSLADLALGLARGGGNSTVTVRSARVDGTARVLLSRWSSATGDSTISLDGLLEPEGDAMSLPVRIEGSGAPIFYSLTVNEVPLEPPTRPDAQGLIVERWYERYEDGNTVTEVKEGDLVRGRLRITVPADREFVAVEDLLPAGLEVVDPSLRTTSLGPFQSEASREAERRGVRANPVITARAWLYGQWVNGWWSPWEHQETRDDRVVYFARALWKGTYTATYVARATTAGTFIRPPAHAEEMYNPSLGGRSEGGVFRITPK